jgi:aspartyl-tRNA(Asn)/glutamyl-tRNA(Gln) amidotransferase subunit A
MNQPPKTITEVREGLKNKEFSSVELVDYFLNRINKFDNEINSFITISDEIAYKQAKHVDKLLSQDKHILEDKPLLGIPIAHKDMFLTQGLRTTAASKVLEDFIPPYSATVVNRLEDAGAITLGKLNQDAWAHGSSGENSDFGPTKNPWDKSYVPGGSSSGSAAALAAGFAVATTGTDTCGSIRLPASFCGIVGFKPTYGAVSRYGVIAMASSLDSIGHLARSVEDIETIYSITKGDDGLDATVKNAPNYKIKNSPTIGIPSEFFTGDLDKEVENSILAAINVLKKIGVKFKEVSLPLTKYAISVYYIIQPAEVSSNLARYDGVRYGNNRDYFGQEAKRRIMLGSYVLSSGYYDAYYKQAMGVRTKIINDLDKVYKEVDALIAPVAPTSAFKLGEKVNDPLKMYLTDIYAATANLTSTPSLALPSGFNNNGLPLGFQLMGPRFSEPQLFELGKTFQKHTDWHKQSPTL